MDYKRIRGTTCDVFTLACKQGYVSIAVALLTHGLAAETYEFDESPIYCGLALKHGLELVYAALAAGYDPNQRRLYAAPFSVGPVNVGESFLHIATEAGNGAAASALVAAGADVHAATESGRTAMWGAVDRADEAMIELLCDLGADVNTEIVRRFDNDVVVASPLVVACGKVNIDLATKLLAAGADPNVSSNRGTQTNHQPDPVVIALGMRSAPLLELLVRKGAVPCGLPAKLRGPVDPGQIEEAVNAHRAAIRKLIGLGGRETLPRPTDMGRLVILGNEVALHLPVSSEAVYVESVLEDGWEPRRVWDCV